MSSPAEFLAALGVQTSEASQSLSAPVTLAIGQEAAQTFEGQVAFITAARLLTRLYQSVHMHGADAPVVLNIPGERLFAAAELWAEKPLCAVSQPIGQVLGIGDIAPVSDAVYLGIQGWRIKISAAAPCLLPSQGDGNPLGAVAGASLGVAEVFKRTTVSAVSTPVQELDFSTFDYRADGSGQNPPLPINVSIGEVVQFGIGSVGSALLYTLQFIERLEGALELVDDDRALSERNLTRYVHATEQAVKQYAGQPKVNWAAASLARCSRLTVSSYPVSVRTYTRTRALQPPIKLAVSAVDNVPARRDIVDALPGRVLNAATGTTRVNVTRHGFNDGLACLLCDYVDRGVVGREPIAYYAQLTGLPDGRVYALIHERQSLTQADLNIMVQAAKLSYENSSQYLNAPFEDLIKDGALYASTSVTTPDGSRVITLAFISAFTGALLAGEVLKEALPELTTNWVGNHYEQDLLHTPNEMRHLRPQQAAEINTCLCRHYARQRFHRRLHPHSSR